MKKLILALTFLTIITTLYAQSKPFPVGMVASFPTNSIPAGFMECDGRLLLRDSYPELFAVLGTSYGSTAANNFRIPDYRGRFLRGWNHGSGVDPNASTRTNRGDGTSGDVVGSKQADAFKGHNHGLFTIGRGDDDDGEETGFHMIENRLERRSISNLRSSNIGGAETRPKNTSVVWCIRAVPATEAELFTDTNVYLGLDAGANNTSGTANTFVGNRAGYNETGSDKLYIANSDTATPLIYGEFDNNKLQVNGELRVTDGILVNTIAIKLQSDWPDYVFAKDYSLPSLKEVGEYIAEHQHLPGIPSAEEVKRDGLVLEDIVTRQMAKIEELTLYLIEKEKRIQRLEKEVQNKDNALVDILQRLQLLEDKSK